VTYTNKSICKRMSHHCHWCMSSHNYIREDQVVMLQVDAELLARYIEDENTSRVWDHAMNADELKEAAARILKESSK